MASKNAGKPYEVRYRYVRTVPAGGVEGTHSMASVLVYATKEAALHEGRRLAQRNADVTVWCLPARAGLKGQTRLIASYDAVAPDTTGAPDVGAGG